MSTLAIRWPICPETEFNGLGRSRQSVMRQDSRTDIATWTLSATFFRCGRIAAGCGKNAP